MAIIEFINASNNTYKGMKRVGNMSYILPLSIVNGVAEIRKNLFPIWIS